MDSSTIPTEDAALPSISQFTAPGMDELNYIGYNGGVYHWDGPHNVFCEVCGGSNELFGCQTCNMSYHADCMSPTLQNEEVPMFWFCPHCVDDNFHIPPEPPTTNFTPTSIPGSSASNANSFTPASEGLSLSSPAETMRGGQAYLTPQTPFLTPSEYARNSQTTSEQTENQQALDEILSAPPPRQHMARTIRKPDTHSFVTLDPPAKRGRPKRAQSPAKKKSKYSTFSSEVDKALAVIHNELEMAAENGRSENQLHEHIKTLEQQLKLQEGQIALIKREHERTKRELLVDRVKLVRLEAAVRSPHQEVVELRALVAEKDAELVDWRAKLKSLIGP